MLPASDGSEGFSNPAAKPFLFLPALNCSAQRQPHGNPSQSAVGLLLSSIGLLPSFIGPLQNSIGLLRSFIVPLQNSIGLLRFSIVPPQNSIGLSQSSIVLIENSIGLLQYAIGLLQSSIGLRQSPLGKLIRKWRKSSILSVIAGKGLNDARHEHSH